MSEIPWTRRKCDKSGKRKDLIPSNLLDQLDGDTIKQLAASKGIDIEQLLAMSGDGSNFGQFSELLKPDQRNDKGPKDTSMFSFGAVVSNPDTDEGKEDERKESDENEMYKDVNHDEFLFGNVDHDHIDSLKFIPQFGCKIFKARLVGDHDCDLYDYETDCKLFKMDYTHNLNNENCYSNTGIMAGNDGIIKLPYGAIDTSPCHAGLPIIYSEPHFFAGDDMYQTIVKGLSPDRSQHEAWLTVDPVCGGVIQRKMVGQVNVLINQNTFQLNQKENNFTNHVLFPIMWWDGDLRISRKSMKDIWMMKELSEILGWSIGSFIASIGFLLIAYFGAKVTG